MKYDAKQAAAFFDEYGEREWTRFEDGRTPIASVATHCHYLRRFVEAGDRVLYRWADLSALLAAHGEIAAAAATGLFTDSPEHEDLLARLELDLGAEPGAIDAGRHILAVVRV